VNSGVELQINSLVVDNPGFTWDLGANVTFLSNELRDYNGPNFVYGTLFGQGISGATIHRLASDQPLNAFYLRDWQGLNDEGFDTFIDADGDLVENTSDAFYLGDPNPDVLLGISSTMTFGNFSFLMNFNGAFGQDIYNNTKNTVTPIGNLGSRNIDATLVGNSVQENTANSVKSSTRYLESGSYVKLANATLSYNIGDIGSAIGDARVYISGTNLLLFTGYEGFDPEVNTVNDANGLPSAGIDYIPYPSARTIILGVNFYL
jgi:iron complex outermembrane receptor protein